MNEKPETVDLIARYNEAVAANASRRKNEAATYAAILGGHQPAPAPAPAQKPVTRPLTTMTDDELNDRLFG